jgi:hypothetical protein
LSQGTLPHLYQETLYHIPPRVAVVVNKPWDAYSADDKALLSKILASVKLNLAMVQVISLPALSLSSLRAYNPAKVIIFGSQADDIKSYEAVQAQGFTVLRADDLPQLDDVKKKNLWLALKTVFGL